MTGFYVAAMVVALLQYLRARDLKLLPLMLLFAFAAGSRAIDPVSEWATVLDLLSGACGLSLIYLMAPGHLHRSAPRPAPQGPR